MTWLDVNEQDDERLKAFMAQVASLPARRPAAEASQIWWKAQLLRRWDAERKVVAPLDFIQPVEIAAALGTLGVLLYRSLPYLF